MSKTSPDLSPKTSKIQDIFSYEIIKNQLLHDFGNRLYTVTIGLENVKLEVPEDIAAQVTTCIDQLQELREFIRQQLTENPKLNKKAIDLQQYCVRFLRGLRPLTEMSSILLDYKLSSDSIPLVVTDPNLLGFILDNIVLNSVKALRSYEDNKRIEVELHSDSNRVRLSIRDNGPGIDSDVLKDLKTQYQAILSREVFHPKVQTYGMQNIFKYIAMHEGKADIEMSNVRASGRYRIGDTEESSHTGLTVTLVFSELS